MEVDKEVNQQIDQISSDSNEQEKEEEDDNVGPIDVRNSPYDKISGMKRKYRNILKNSYVFPELFNKEFCQAFRIPEDQIDF